LETDPDQTSKPAGICLRVRPYQPSGAIKFGPPQGFRLVYLQH